MPSASVLMILFSVLVPSKMWYAPSQPLMVRPDHQGELTLLLADFVRPDVAKATANVTGGQEVDLKEIFPVLNTPGTHILYAAPKDKGIDAFIGTPLVIQGRADKRPGMGNAMQVIRVEPLRYATMTTDQGEMTLAFYYDVAPNTVDSFLRLSEQGYFDGLTFHRIVPNFVIQGGDPLGTGTGGPGYQIDAEFNDRKHEEGVLSMARSGDPLEPQMAPRCEYANSAGSQFFICLAPNEFLNNRYTAFGKVTAGIEAVRKIAAVPLADARNGRPKTPPVIKKIEVKPVKLGENPYLKLELVPNPGEQK